MKEVEFIQVINFIAEKNNCTITKTDVAERIIEIDGPADSQIKCGVEIGDLMELVDGAVEVDEDIQPMKLVKDDVGWVI